MTGEEEVPILTVDGDTVKTLAAASGLVLSSERAADLVPALLRILEADAQISELDLSAFPASGLPWAYLTEESKR